MIELCDDIWIEIMKHLDFDLHHLVCTNKYLHQLFVKYKSRVCDEEHFRFSGVQRNVYQKMMGPRPITFSTNHHPGMKTVILAAAMKLSNVFILTSKCDLDEWYTTIRCLYLNNVQKNHVLVLKHYKAYLHHKVVITTPEIYNCLNFDIKDYIIMSYKIKVPTFAIDIKFVTPGLIDQKVVNYPDTLQNEGIHFECYNNNQSHLIPSRVCNLQPVSSRLKIVVDGIINNHPGPYLIIDYQDYIQDVYVCHSQFTFLIDYQMIDKLLSTHSTIIVVYPWYQSTQIKNIIFDLKYHRKRLNIFYIHSILEEAFLFKTLPVSFNDPVIELQSKPSHQRQFLVMIRNLLDKYTFLELTKVPDKYYYQFVMAAYKYDLQKIEFNVLKILK